MYEWPHKARHTKTLPRVKRSKVKITRCGRHRIHQPASCSLMQSSIVSFRRLRMRLEMQLRSFLSCSVPSTKHLVDRLWEPQQLRSPPFPFVCSARMSDHRRRRRLANVCLTCTELLPLRAADALLWNTASDRYQTVARRRRSVGD